MGKSKGKKQSKAKSKEAKKKKQQEKATKKKNKSKSKNGVQQEEDDLEALLKEYEQKDLAKQEVQVTVMDTLPSPRNYFTINVLGKTNEVILFGGEFFDGDKSKCYNELFKFNPSTNEWMNIDAPNAPPPRCSHQAVLHASAASSKIYIFGGEFSTAHSFHHYRDLWEFDVDSSTFKAIHTTTGPSARSGHRMVLYKNLLVLFGGFYETSRGTNFYNDLHFFDIRTQKWFLPKVTSKNKPDARSACHFFHDTGQNCFFLYGGYTKVKGRGKSLQDFWQLSLSFDIQGSIEASWLKLTTKGYISPGRRSGATSFVFKNKLVLFGGVQDRETQNDVEGEFFADLYSLDYSRKRWYKLERNLSTSRNKSRRRKTDNRAAPASTALRKIDEEEAEISDVEDFDENAFYYIVDNKMVKVEIEQDYEEIEPENDTKGSVLNSDKEENVENEVQDQLNPSQDTNLQEEFSNQAIGVADTVETVVEEPAPRIAAGCFVVNKELYILFGTAELQDYHVNFDDFWKIDVFKENKWTCIVEGDWANKIDKVEVDENDVLTEEENDIVSVEGDLDGAFEEYIDEEYFQNISKEKKKLQKLLEKYDDTLLPEPKETLRSFFKRTGKLWVDKYVSKLESLQTHEAIHGKELRRKAFELCMDRYENLADVLGRLDGIEEEQKELEKEAVKQVKIDAIRAAGGSLKKKKK